VYLFEEGCKCKECPIAKEYGLEYKYCLYPRVMKKASAYLTLSGFDPGITLSLSCALIIVPADDFPEWEILMTEEFFQIFT
jgi:hypothetical protein